MPAKIHCVRHAQGLHNLGPQNYHIIDPKLTPLGLEQCAILSANLQNKFKVDKSRVSLITASPMTRTLHTAYLTFQDVLEDPTGWGLYQRNILAIPDVQETSSFRNDTGSEPEVLKEICRIHGWPVDLSLVHKGWTDKSFNKNNRYVSTNTAITNRARDARILLRQKARELEKQGVQDPEIVVVSHGGFLHYLTGDWEDAFTGVGTGWRNTEIRSYQFQGGEDDPNAFIIETELSREIRGKSTPMMPAGGKQQKEWLDITMHNWEKDGMQTGYSVERELEQGQKKPRQGSIEMDSTGELAQLQPTRSVEDDTRKSGAIKASA